MTFRNNSRIAAAILLLAFLLSASVAASDVQLQRSATQEEAGQQESSSDAAKAPAATLSLWGVMSSGGATAISSGDNTLGFTVGQTVVGISSDGNNTVYHGFWQDFSAPTSPCCMNGTTGNVNYDPEDLCDIVDVTTLVNHLFVTFQPLVCRSEANTSGDANCDVDVADLTRMVNWQFVTFEPMPGCQPQCV